MQSDTPPCPPVMYGTYKVLPSHGIDLNTLLDWIPLFDSQTWVGFPDSKTFVVDRRRTLNYRKGHGGYFINVKSVASLCGDQYDIICDPQGHLFHPVNHLATRVFQSVLRDSPVLYGPVFLVSCVYESSSADECLEEGDHTLDDLSAHVTID